MVSQTTGFVVQPNKAVVGANAFAHASGIHQDGVLKARDTYEIMRAEDVGWSANKIVLGKLSGRNAFKQRLQDLGVALEARPTSMPLSRGSRNWPTARARFSTRTSWPWSATRACHARAMSTTTCVSLSQHSETGERPHAAVVFTVDGKEVRGESDGNGPVDAIPEGHRVARQERRRNGAVFGQRHQRIAPRARAR